MTVNIVVGDVLTELAKLPAESVHCCVTSPPYWGLRDYKTPPQVWGGEPGCQHEWQDASWRAARWGSHDDDKPGEKQRTNAGALGHRGQTHDQAICRHCNAWRGSLGLEPTPALYIEHMVSVFREVRRVLRADGTLWLNIADSYAGSWGAQGRRDTKSDDPSWHSSQIKNHPKRKSNTGTIRQDGLKPKDLIGVPWMLAFALRADGWWLRKDIIWSKKAPMPESCTDRPTSAHEYVFLLSKSSRYFYDANAVREDFADERMGADGGAAKSQRNRGGRADGFTKPSGIDPSANGGRNLRDVWHLGPEPFPEAHFATFPTEIPKRAILAGSSERGICQKCGASWSRAIKKSLVPGPKAARTFVVDERDISADANDQGSNRQKDGHKPGWRRADKTIGWRPTCDCDAGDPVPATVLDCFLGSGTTALVADRLGRDCIGIELSDEYAAMAERRVRKDAGIFASASIQKLANIPELLQMEFEP